MVKPAEASFSDDPLDSFMKEIDANATKQEKYDEFTFDNESMQPSVTENQSGGTYSLSFGADANGMKA